MTLQFEKNNVRKFPCFCWIIRNKITNYLGRLNLICTYIHLLYIICIRFNLANQQHGNFRTTLFLSWFHGAHPNIHTYLVFKSRTSSFFPQHRPMNSQVFTIKKTCMFNQFFKNPGLSVCLIRSLLCMFMNLLKNFPPVLIQNTIRDTRVRIING